MDVSHDQVQKEDDVTCYRYRDRDRYYYLYRYMLIYVIPYASRLPATFSRPVRKRQSASLGLRMVRVGMYKKH